MTPLASSGPIRLPWGEGSGPWPCGGARAGIAREASSADLKFRGITLITTFFLNYFSNFSVRGIEA